MRRTHHLQRAEWRDHLGQPTEVDLKDLAEVMAKVPVTGERYNAQMMKTINR